MSVINEQRYGNTNSSSLSHRFFSENNVVYISGEITRRLKVLLPHEGNIIVPKPQIIKTMDAVFDNARKNLNEMNKETVEYITDFVYSDLAYDQGRNNFSALIFTDPESFGLNRISGVRVKESRKIEVIDRY